MDSNKRGPTARADGVELEGGKPSVSGRRRNFLLQSGTTLCAVTGLGVVKAVWSYLRPGALMEPLTRVVVCKRDRVTDETVLFDKNQKVILVGTTGGIYAMSAVCPHLGCMTSYRSESRLIECACHGSAFTLKGEALHGPSPPLHWLDVNVNKRNEVVVDTATVVPAGKMFEG